MSALSLAFGINDYSQELAFCINCEKFKLSFGPQWWVVLKALSGGFGICNLKLCNETLLACGVSLGIIIFVSFRRL